MRPFAWFCPLHGTLTKGGNIDLIKTKDKGKKEANIADLFITQVTTSPRGGTGSRTQKRKKCTTSLGPFEVFQRKKGRQTGTMERVQWWKTVSFRLFPYERGLGEALLRGGRAEEAGLPKPLLPLSKRSQKIEKNKFGVESIEERDN